MSDLRPAFEMVTEDEARAMRIAVRLALSMGIASDDTDSTPSNRSLVSLAKKLGIETDA